MNAPKVSMINLGCPKNIVDSEQMLGVLAQDGFRLEDRPEQSDVVVINTCAFIDAAKQESIDHILQVVELKKQGRVRAIVVAGCLPQRYRQELIDAIPEVDAWVGTETVTGIGQVLRRIQPPSTSLRASPAAVINAITDERVLFDEFTPRRFITPPHTAYLKIAEGCDNPCSFCIIPNIRGKFRSRTVQSVVAEARAMSRQGVKEICLVAQDTTDFGRDRTGKSELDCLVRALDDVDGHTRWIRPLYTYPAHFTEDLITALAASRRFIPYIDMPIQHIDDMMLKRMVRRLDERGHRDLITKLRDRIGSLVLRSTLIVGFPGETETQFEKLLRFIEEVQFDRLGIFMYSHEEGTPAGRLPDDVPEKEKRRRFDLAMAAQQQVACRVNRKFLGRRLEVLIDEESKEDRHPQSADHSPQHSDLASRNTLHASRFLYLGRSYADAPEVDGMVYVHSDRELKVGEFVDVTITDTYEYDLVGRAVVT